MSTTKPQADVDLILHVQSAMAALAQWTAAMDRATRKMEAQFGRVAKESKEVEKSTGLWDSGIARALITSGTLMGVFTSLRTLASVIRMDIEAAAQGAEKARGMSTSFNDYMAQIHHVLTPDSDMNINQIYEAIMKSGIPDKTKAAAGVLHGIGVGISEPVSQRVANVLRVGEMRPDLTNRASGEFESMISAVGIAQRVYPEYSSEEILAAMEMASSVSLINDTVKFAQSVGPTLTGMKRMGFTLQEALSMNAAYSQSLGDTHGEVTRTLLMTATHQLHSEFRKRGRMEEGSAILAAMKDPNDPVVKEIRQYLASYLEEGLTKEEAEELAQLRSRPHAEGRARGKPSFIQSLESGRVPKGEEHWQSLYESAMQQILVGPEGAEFWKKHRAELVGQPWFQAAQLQISADKLRNNAFLDPSLAMSGIQRSQSEELSQMSGIGSFSLWATRAMWGLGDAVTKTRPDEMESLRRTYTSNRMQQQKLLSRYGWYSGDISFLPHLPMEDDRFSQPGAALRRDREVGPDEIVPLSDILNRMHQSDANLFRALEAQIEELRQIKRNLENGIPVEEKNKPVQAPKQPAAAGR